MLTTYHPLIPWLAFALAAGAVLIFDRYKIILFAVLTIALYQLCSLPLSYASRILPHGEYSILGARIDYNEAIYVMLNMEKPRLFVLPYSEENAMALQEAMNGNGAIMGNNGGEMAFEEAPGKDVVK